MKTAQGILDLIEGKELEENNETPLRLIERESVKSIK